MSDEPTSKPTSRRQRFFKLAGMTASVAGNFATNRVKGLFQRQDERERARAEADARSGERIAKTLGELKGAAMKLGQMASMAKDILPNELASALTGLQREAPPMSFDVIRDQIASELGSPPELLFERFDPEPFAAASIGQVHRARTDDGREVVCKVQYPGVDTSVDSDIAHLKFALRASGLLRVPKRALDGLFEELRDRLKEELDYTNEAENVRLFQRLHRDDPHIVIPEVVGERSSGRILTLTYEPGDSIIELPEERYDQATRNLIGERLVHMMYRQIFAFHAVHGDPNPANFACRDNGDLVVYDFGCVKRFPEQMMADYKHYLGAVEQGEQKAIDHYLQRLEVRVPGTPPPSQDFFDAIQTVFSRLRDGDPLDMQQATLHDDFLKVLPIMMKHPRQLQPSRHIALLDRVQTGHYQNLRQLKAVIPYWGIYHHYMHLPQLGDADYVAP